MARAGDYDAQYLSKDDTIYAVFHRRGRLAWTHKPGEECEVCDGKRR